MNHRTSGSGDPIILHEILKSSPSFTSSFSGGEEIISHPLNLSSGFVGIWSAADSLECSVSSLTGCRLEIGTSIFFRGETPRFDCVGGVRLLPGEGDLDFFL